MSEINVKEATGLYEDGIPLPGEQLRNDKGSHVIGGYAGETLPFGRLIAASELQSDDAKLYNEIDDSTLKSDGVSAYSIDGYDDVANLRYSAGEAVGIKNRGYIIMEMFEDLDLTNLDLTVTNGGDSGQTTDDIGKLAQTTGAGFSTVTAIRVTRKISATLVEVHINGPIELVPGS